MSDPEFDVMAVLDREIASAGGEAFEVGRDLIAVKEAVAKWQHKARCWDDLVIARTKPQTEADDGWKQLVREGKEIEAVKLVRHLHGYSLRESKAVVDGFREKINSQ